MKEYQNILSELHALETELARKDRQISFLRLICLLSGIILLYQYFAQQQVIWLVAGVLTLVAFGLIVKYHLNLRWRARFTRERIAVNEDELAFLGGDASAFATGEAFIQSDHPYSFDLDFFGTHSLYQALNRTTTVTGQEKLAASLLSILPNQDIYKKQEAIKELAMKLEWRQTFQALARMEPDSNESYKELIEWSEQKPVVISRVTTILSYLLPIIMLCSFGYYIITFSGIAGNISGLLFLVNLGVLGSFSKSIKQELVKTTQIEKILKQYAYLLKEIEQQDFASEALRSQQDKMDHQGRKASLASTGLLFFLVEWST